MPIPHHLIRSRPIRTRLILAALIAAAAAILQAGLWFPPGLPAGDLTIAYFSEHIYQARWMAEGRIPFWNRHSFFGSPGAATMQYGCFYPPNLLLYWLLPPIAAMKANLLLHLVMAGWLMAWLVSRLGAGRFGQFAAAVFYMGCGHLAAKSGHVSHFPAVCLAPGALAALAGWLEARRPRDLLWLAGITAAILLAGYMQAAAMAGILAGGFALAWLVSPNSGARDKAKRKIAAKITATIASKIMVLGGALGAAFWALAIAALPLLLTLDFIPHTHRAAISFEDFSILPLPVSQIPILFFPLAAKGYVNEFSGWMGLAAPVLAALALVLSLRGWRSRWRRWRGTRQWRRRNLLMGLAVLGVFGFVAALGAATPLCRILYHIPVINSFRVPGRWLLLTDFCLAALAGIGAHHLWAMARHLRSYASRDERKNEAWLWIIAISATAVAAAAAIAGWRIWSVAHSNHSGIWAGHFSAAGRFYLIPVAIAAATALFFLLNAWTRRPAIRRAALSLILLAFLTESSWIFWRFNAYRDRALWLDTQTHPVLQAMRRTAGDFDAFRLYPVCQERDFLNLAPSTHLPHRARSYSGYGPLFPAELAVLFGTGSTGLINNLDFMIRDNRILSMFNIRYLVVANSDSGEGGRVAALLESVRAPWNSRADGMNGGKNGEAPSYVEIPLDADIEAARRASANTNAMADVLARSHIKLYENRNCLPPAWSVRRLVSASDSQNPSEALLRTCGWLYNSASDFNPFEEAVFSGPIPPDLARRADSEFSQARIGPIRWSGPNRFRTRVESDGEAFVVFAEPFFPGWRALVDGSPAPLHRVNALLTGLALPTGKHRVELSYRPRMLLPGAAISLSALAFWVVAALGLITRSLIHSKDDFRHLPDYSARMEEEA